MEEEGIYFTNSTVSLSAPIKIYKNDEVELVFARLKKRGVIAPDISQSVRRTIADMDEQGFSALQNYSSRFDQFALSKENIRVSEQEINVRAQLLTQEQKQAIDFSFAQTSAFQNQIALGIKAVESANDYGRTAFIPRPIRRVGIYAPGGLAPLPSSLLMAGVSARAAGVKEFVVCTPPRKEGLNPAIAYLARKLDITEIYLLGGVAAIWFMANGISRLSKPVDKICGPGNSYVSEAKSQLAQAGKVGIDMIAGPSEVFLLADETANSAFVAADLLAQAEHGITSSAILVTNSSVLAAKVQKEIEMQLSSMRRKAEIQQALENCGAIFVVDDLETKGIALANEFGPEHLEMFCEVSKRDRILQNAKVAGAIFIDTGEAFADYGVAGSNHILPTGNSVRFSSGLSVRDFLVWTYVDELKPDAQRALADSVGCFANMENLEAHSNAARIRKR